MKTMYLLSGPPASGKSTWARKKLGEFEPGKAIWHSRDLVRFSIIQEDEDYFAHENEVFSTWIKAIQKSIESSEIEVIIVDATHINDRSRNKTLRNLKFDPIEVEVINVVFDPDIKTLFRRNIQRKGRERVPDDVIRKMHKDFYMPHNGYETIIGEW